MPLNAVMQHVKEAIDGTAMPSGLTFDGTNQVPSLHAHISVPIGTVVSDAPHAFVWGSKVKEGRQTMGGPRARTVNTTSPFRDANYRMDIVIRYALPNTIANSDSCFPAIIDTVTEVLRGVTMPVVITDELTGRQSTITEIGEEFDIDFGGVYQMKDQRYWMYGAKITMQVHEKFQQ